MNLRLFLAIPIPENVADRLATLEADVPGASWRLPEQYHLTLRFIGDVDGATARDIDTELGRILAAPFEISLQGAGSFGGREPSALWAGVSPSPPLLQLANATGGRLLEPAELPGFLKSAFIPEAPVARSSGAVWQPSWTRWPLALLIALPLALEWYLRRRQGLA